MGLALVVASLIGGSVSAWAKTPTPTSSPTSTPTDGPTPTSTPDGSACTTQWPQSKIATIGKGQSPSNNPKVSHVITGHIIDPGSLGNTAHRIEVCAGTWVNVAITDTTGTPTNTAGGSLACSATGCSGVVNATEKYKSVSSDGKDTDRITLLPR